MAEKGSSSLTSLFNWHTMMNVAMFGMVAAMVFTATPNPMLGDWIVQTGHMFLQGFQGLISAIPAGGDALTNLFNGQFMPSTWDAGMMHAGGTAATAHTAHTGMVASTATTTAAASAHAGHAAMATCPPFADWSLANPAQAEDLTGLAAASGVSPAQYYQSTFCHS
jgi:hypothetical protein